VRNKVRFKRYNSISNEVEYSEWIEYEYKSENENHVSKWKAFHAWTEKSKWGRVGSKKWGRYSSPLEIDNVKI